MSREPGDRGDRSWVAALGLMLLPILCCALPLLIAAGGLGVIGSVLRNPLVIGAAVLILVGLVGWAVRRRAAGSADACAPKTSSREDGPGSGSEA
jgi:hypothetical protein